MVRVCDHVMRDDEPTRDDVGERPPLDPRHRAVARAKIEDALFATGARVELGRYHLLMRVGAGGMGVVWGAWDPELERRVAIKLVRVASSPSREQVLREGQALAKLSHPNVVPVYDVGSVDDEVYLVMEWIAGGTLREFAATPRRAREIVAVYRAAGEGLVAAHAAGIVHRDFKPDNVIVGDDGRVRVLDFGLARAEATGDGRVAGTPRYMAPEQASGAAATPAADQFSFCVSLRETLGGTVPSWLAAIVARGSAADPGARYPDMKALLAALARDPARVWRRRAVIAGALVLAGGAFAVGTLRAPATEPCAADGDELAGEWSPAIAAEVGAHARTLGAYGVLEAPVLAAHLGRYSERWLAARHGACIAHHRDELPAEVYTRTLACLERARGALDATVGAASRATLEHFPEVVLAVEALPDAQQCALVATSNDVAGPSPAQVPIVSSLGADAARAQYLALASDPRALPIARSVAAAAGVLAYRPLVARAQLALGAALQNTSEQAARPAYAAAAQAALAGGDDVLFVEAFARELFVAGRSATGAAALVDALPFVVTLAQRTGDAGRFARALLYNNAGTERLAAGDVGGSVRWFEQARAEPEDDRATELWAVVGNLAMTVADPAQRDALFAEQRRRLERTLGPDHAFTLQERLRAALFVEDPAAAAAQLRDVCAAFATYYPERLDKVGSCNYELAWLAFARGDQAEARRAYAIVVAGGAEHAAVARAALALLGGDPAGAARDAEALARTAAAATTWWKRFAAVDAWLVVAQAEQLQGHTAAAAAAARSAQAVLASPGFNTTATYYRRRLARVRELLTGTG